jgi:hypothetical protein
LSFKSEIQLPIAGATTRCGSPPRTRQSPTPTISSCPTSWCGLPGQWRPRTPSTTLTLTAQRLNRTDPERRMLPVLDLDPAIGPATAISALAVLGDQALQPPAGRHGGTGPDRSRPVRIRIKRFRRHAAPGDGQGWFCASIAATCGDPRRRSPGCRRRRTAPRHRACECRPLKSDRPSTPSSTASPSITNDEFRLRSAASDISGNRSDQSWPLRVHSRTRSPSRCTIRR